MRAVTPLYNSSLPPSFLYLLSQKLSIITSLSLFPTQSFIHQAGPSAHSFADRLAIHSFTTPTIYYNIAPYTGKPRSAPADSTTFERRFRGR